MLVFNIRRYAELLMVLALMFIPDGLITNGLRPCCMLLILMGLIQKVSVLMQALSSDGLSTNVLSPEACS